MKILVIGDSCIDKFIYGSCERICPEAPVPVFNPLSSTENIGMAGNVKNNLESPVDYQINGAFGTIFSNSFGLIEVENFFNDLILTSFSAGMPCGISLSNSFVIKSDSSNIPIIINPDSSVFFLKIQNSQNSYIDSVTIKNNFLFERCNNISIPNDNQVYSIGYFSLNNGNETKIIAHYGTAVDTIDVDFYNESIKIDTLIIN